MSQTLTNRKEIVIDATVERTIYNYWDGAFRTTEAFENRLLDFSKEELVAFIVAAQSQGAFKKIVHP